MDSAAQKLLESATQRTLHAHAFSRSSSQASVVLTDLLSCYLALVTSTCAKYAQHAGRTELTVHDAVGALDELGVSINELAEYGALEGRELNRYALHSARRVEDLNEFRAHLSDGLRQDRDDAISLEYTRYTTPALEESEGEDEEAEWDEEETEFPATWNSDNMDVDMPPPRSTSPLGSKRTPPRPSTPTLPLSPISNPSSPSRKRPRTSSWQPPSHIPDFLPPFPTITDSRPVSPENISSPQATQPAELPPSQIEEVKVEKPPISVSQTVTSAAASDFLVQVPYSQSSLSSVPERHLPQPPRSLPPLLSRTPRLPLPQTEPALFGAYHHILTHPPPPAPPTSNPSRHKVAMALLSQIQATPRWDAADTLFSSVGPCAPRVAPIAPTHPIPISSSMPDIKGKDSKDKDFKFPPSKPRPLAASERLSPLISQQPSRIPDLSRHVLPPSILARTTRLSHPAVLHRGTRPLVYGNGIAAPWNTKPTPVGNEGVPATPVTAKPKDTEKEPPVKPVLPDAQLFATWDYEPKSFKVPLARNRARMGSIQAGGSGVISLPVIPRSKSTK